jgi:hypothetical protein
MASSSLFPRPDALGAQTQLDDFLEERLARDWPELAEAGILLYDTPAEL